MGAHPSLGSHARDGVGEGTVHTAVLMVKERTMPTSVKASDAITSPFNGRTNGISRPMICQMFIP